MSETLALYGGPKAKTTPYAPKRRFDDAELVALKEALDQQTLFYAAGSQVKTFCRQFASLLGVRHCIATSSGTAAIHVALGALGVGPGDEVITVPITDMGTLTGILFQNAIPVFCDVEPDTYSMDIDDLKRKISPRTKAIIPVHLSGNPNDMEPILDVANRHGIPVIEDCAQAYLAEYRGRPVGTWGTVGCFSLNDFKHISAGDGGMLVTDDDEIARRAALFADKWYDRSGGRGERRIEYLAPNYRMSELHGAVARAQLKKLPAIVARRQQIAARWDRAVASVRGLYATRPPQNSKSAYWFYLLRVEQSELGADRDLMVKALNAEGVPAWGPYVARVKYLEPLFVERHAYFHTSCPFDCPLASRKVEYRPGLCPVSERLVDTTFIVPLYEWYTDQDVEETALAIEKVGRYFNTRARSD